MKNNDLKLKTIDIFSLKKEDFNLGFNTQGLLEKLNSEDDFSISELINLSEIEFDTIYKIMNHYSNILLNNLDTEQYLNNMENPREKFLLQKSIYISAANALSKDLHTIKTTIQSNSIDILY